MSRITLADLNDKQKAMIPEAHRSPLGNAALTHAEALAKADEKAELNLQSDIASYLRLHEIEYIKPDGRKKSPLPKGWPDFTYCYCGVAVGMEVKTSTGQLSSDQETKHAKMKRNGWRVVIVRSIADVQSLLRTIDAEIQPRGMV
jgi:hypothetical protein